MDNFLVTTHKNYRVLICHRELTSTTIWENGRPVKYPEVKIHFEPLRIGETRKLATVISETPENALEAAHNLFFLGSPLRHSLAVEPC